MAGIGQIVGAFLILALISVLIEKGVSQRFFDDPVKGKVTSVAAAWLLISIIAGFGMADGGPYAWKAFLIYGIPAAILAVIAALRGRWLRDDLAIRD